MPKGVPTIPSQALEGDITSAFSIRSFSKCVVGFVMDSRQNITLKKIITNSKPYVHIKSNYVVMSGVFIS